MRLELGVQQVRPCDVANGLDLPVVLEVLRVHKGFKGVRALFQRRPEQDIRDEHVHATVGPKRHLRLAFARAAKPVQDEHGGLLIRRRVLLNVDEVFGLRLQGERKEHTKDNPAQLRHPAN